MPPDDAAPPPLLVTPLESLSPPDRAEFVKESTDLGRATAGVVITIPFPVALYHRIDGVWLPVTDLGAFQDLASTKPPAPSGPSVACEDADDD